MEGKHTAHAFSKTPSRLPREMSSVSSSSRGSRSTLSEETEQMVSYWERFMPGLNRQPEPPLDDSQYVAATNRGTANSGTSATDQRSRKTRRSSRPDSGVNQYGVPDTESLIADRSVSREGDVQVPSVHWVRALCLAMMALSSALFIGAVAVALMHSLPSTWPPPQPRDAKAQVTAIRANPGKGNAEGAPVIQNAAKLENALSGPVRVTTKAATKTRASAPASAGTVLPEGADVPGPVAEPRSRHQNMDLCQRVFFKFCTEPRREFYFNPATNACVALSGLSVVEVCNRSPNRFPTALGCSRQCIRTRYPAEKCFKAALLSKCGRDDVVNGSNLWFFDGRGCHLWSFPSGKCPSRDGQLFSSAGRCRDACARRRAGSFRTCRTPKPASCDSRQLKFPFFAADFGRDVSLRCLSTTTIGEAPQRCLAGANRFRTRAACKEACVRVVGKRA
ncbi:uncharacterized protein LOC119169800 isoform X2 [Rhipicephalus microplus]|uniref:uncharacterized protein LOC119169800 isoform X2 n=1 Tax=Rhipicephalus microplus TaxID=6941 RepID=UPI003F6C2A85